jgi:membrane protein YdbS with pleckstrin-like domain
MSDDATPAWLALAPGERVVWSGGPRIQTAFPGVLAGLGVLVGSVAAALFVEWLPLAFALLGLLGVPLAAYPYLRVSRTKYVVTTDALAAKHGVLGRHVQVVGLDSVQNSTAEQGPLGAAFGYGTVGVDTAGGEGTELRFARVEDPQRVRRLVDERRRAADGDEIPGSVAQWAAIRDEVRRWRRSVERTE